MKLNINKLKITPKNLPFGFCVYGEPTHEMTDWAEFWNLKMEKSGQYTNFLLEPETVLSDIFEEPTIYEYGDFFSPNLNKHLHLGHLSNLIIAKSLQSLGIAKNTIAILGDTLDGEVSKEEALSKYNEYCDKFGYSKKIYYASEQELKMDILVDGTDSYEGTKIFEILLNNEIHKTVGIKSDGSTSYFYQDVALASTLNASTLYVTGSEQNGHFKILNVLFPKNAHIGLGLVLTDGKKQSSSAGNVIFMEKLLELVKDKFNQDEKLTWNILCGFILKYDLPSTKDIKLKDIDNVNLSHGLYLSYALARLKSAGMTNNPITTFNSKVLQYKLLRAKTMVKPHLLFEELIETCGQINKLYVDHYIKDNLENQKLYQPLMDDLVHGMELLGMFPVSKV